MAPDKRWKRVCPRYFEARASCVPLTCHTPSRIVGSTRNQPAERPMKRLGIASIPPANPTSPVSTVRRSQPLERGTVSERLETLRATFDKNRHRYAFRRRAVIDEMFVLAATELHVNALVEALEAWLPSIEPFEYPVPELPRAMAA